MHLSVCMLNGLVILFADIPCVCIDIVEYGIARFLYDSFLRTV